MSSEFFALFKMARFSNGVFKNCKICRKIDVHLNVLVEKQLRYYAAAASLQLMQSETIDAKVKIRRKGRRNI